MRKVLCLVLVGAMLSGCCSYMVNEKTREQLAVRAQPVDGGVAVGMDVSAWRAIKANPVQHIGAALLDAALIYGTAEGVRALNEYVQNESTEGIRISFENSDGNVITVSNQSEGSTSSSGAQTSPGGSSNFDEDIP